MDKADVFTCRNFRIGSCPRSDAIVLEERADHVQMGCRTCRGGWIVTLPEGVKKARYENRITDLKRQEELRRADKNAVAFGAGGAFGALKI